MSITAKELAKLLNISSATVSMVLNHKPGISDKTRHLVLETAKKYDYDFSRFAAMEQKNGVIHLIIYKKHGTVVTDTPFFSELIEGIENCCQAARYEFQVSYFYEGQTPQNHISEILSTEKKGLLLLGTELDMEYFQPFSDLTIPMVVVDTYFEQLNCDSVLINNVQGAYRATSYLIEKGFDAIGYLHSSYSIGNFEERAEGYYKALRHHNLPTNHPYIHHLRPSLEGSYHDMMDYLHSGNPVASAYFADNDWIAAGAMQALKEFGYAIPDNVAIIGFDGMPICSVTDPPLSTMEVPKKLLGKIAVEQLIKKINRDTEETVKIELSPRLCERRSTNKHHS